jgi:glycosyltransferase involved in cell wall biosynthesis
MSILRLAVVQQWLVPYRLPVFRALAEHPEVSLTVIHGTTPPVTDGELGLTTCQGLGEPFATLEGPIPGLRWAGKSLLWHRPAIRALRRWRFDAVIHNFATRWASFWPARWIQRGRGGAFLLWGHGFSKTPTPWLDRLRLGMVRSADAVILYSDTHRRRYIQMGAQPEKLFVAPNSVDLAAINLACERWNGQVLAEFRRRRGLDDGPVLLHVGRLAPDKRLDVLLTAAAALRKQYPGLKVVLVGEGPSAEPLKRQAVSLHLDGVVEMPGAIHDEMDLAPWMLSADLVVAPGPIGLLALHAQAYGRTVVFSDDPVLHGPEIKTLVSGQNAMAYPTGDAEALAKTIAALLEDPQGRQAMGLASWQAARAACGVPRMVNGILEAVSYATGQRLRPLPVPDATGLAPCPRQRPTAAEVANG